ncbi:RBBP9/YdeN family alpha/beta hydrolase [Jiangella anatolica]|uniref:Alpha/beta hydrolase n=1 Tax=Jiangella anatolica TaxID=2670374 RepID=A0A2W2BLK8_9ACTN|nr:alpha/beta hydrolase [Jiangella anatolica]PZF81168.1 alpha/beta hydrolase [Jiangella anatolica]
MRYVIVPGINGSGPEHWQSHWEAALGSRAVRIAPASWDEPDASDWRRAVGAAEPRASVLVAHSLGCLAAASWLVRAGAGDRPLGAFLVAPPDRDGPRFPAAAATFTAPASPLPVPAVVVASSDDPYSDLDRAAGLARTWGATFVGVGPRGHLNDASGVGAWAAGRALLAEFTAGLPS